MQSFNEYMMGQLNKNLKIDPLNSSTQYFIVNPPRKFVDENGKVDAIDVPTRFKILNNGIGKDGSGYMTIQNISYGDTPMEQKSPFAGKKYTIKNGYVDALVGPPEGASMSGGGSGGMGGSMGGGGFGGLK